MPTLRFRGGLVAFVALAVTAAACGGGGNTMDGGRVVDTDVPMRPMIPGCDNPAALGGLSARCACDTDCADNLRCSPEDPTASGFAGGICSRSCELDRDCGASGRCVGGFCLAACVVAADCGESRMCSRGVCFPNCADNSQCRSGACNLYDGACIADVGALEGLRRNNEACTSGSQCRSGQCETGYCLGYCMFSRQNCPDGDVCGLNTYVVRASDQGICYPPCVAGAMCPQTGLRCGPTFGVPGEPLSCRP